MKDNHEKIVYHYCSLETFYEIISRKTLRASNIKKSNDYLEVTGTKNVFKGAMWKACCQYKRKNPDNEVFAKFFQNPITQREIDIEKIVEEAIDNDSCTYYCTCFSEKGDLVNQWITYADGGRGVAIGFKESYFEEARIPCLFDYREVKYDLGRAENDLVNEWIRKIDDAFKETDCQYGENVTEEDYYNALFKIINKMVYETVFHKHDSFEAEHEKRLVFYPFGSVRNLRYRDVKREYSRNQIFYNKMLDLISVDEKIGKFKRKQIEFNVKGARIASYVDFDFSAYMPDFISEIILGPRCKVKVDDLDLGLFLLSKGIKLESIKIKKSDSPYC